jgi:hypothetical protein
MRHRKPKTTNILENIKIEFLKSGEMGDYDAEFEWDLYCFEFSKEEQKTFWDRHKKQIMKEFSTEKPGIKPWAYRKFGA